MLEGAKTMHLNKHYYTVEESVNLINKNCAHINITEDDLYHYGEIGLIKLSLHIASRPVYPFNFIDKDEVFIGHCLLHGLVSIEKENLCPLIAKGKHIIHFILYSDILDTPTISNWSLELPTDVINAEASSFQAKWHPKPLSENLQIDGFYFKTDFLFELNTHGHYGLIPYERIPKPLAKSVEKYGLGAPCQYFINQVFTKSDLRITHSQLENFITMQNASSSDSCPVDLQDSKLKQIIMAESVAERDERVSQRAQEIYREHYKNNSKKRINKGTIAQLIHDEEVNIYNVLGKSQPNVTTYIKAFRKPN